MKRTTAVLLLAAALAAPAAAFAAPPSTTEARAAATPDPNKRICKKVNPTGYRLRATKLCATAAEWEQRKFEDRKATTELQTRLPKKAPGD